MPDFSSFSPLLNVALFAVAAIVVWLAGARLARYAAAISAVTGLGQAVIGIVLLAGVTSLPEIGVVLTSAARDNADLALNSIFGSIALQVALLAVVDFVIGRRALTAVVPEPGVMLQGSLNVILIAAAAAAMIVGDVPVLGIGLWAWGLMLAYLVSVWVLAGAEGRRPWLAARDGRVDRAIVEEPAGGGQGGRKGTHGGCAQGSLSSLVPRTAAAGITILIAGFILAQSGEALADQTGIGSSFIGFVLVAFATSLPELSTALSSARQGLFTMAISDILGTNLINVAMVFLIDLVAPGEPVMTRAGAFSVFGVLLAVVVTALFLAGLAERRDRSLLRMGYDSILVLAVYAGGLVFLYFLRQQP
ncbi:cation:H+ antiporter [Chelatococcus caeni]|uniref:Cation:H+ antiporter n=1 Tax=Chelatococcus caeni TaxID=1348468 RepID=A0A840C1Z7_9HYPH|nr:sodium:calcium antiporter [Chelatococcus caeni]MBB4016467.1 cation:H+ antiporter [Chelatococcus caeni]